MGKEHSTRTPRLAPITDAVRTVCTHQQYSHTKYDTSVCLTLTFAVHPLIAVFQFLCDVARPFVDVTSRFWSI